jgi:hypothetical protein
MRSDRIYIGHPPFLVRYVRKPPLFVHKTVEFVGTTFGISATAALIIVPSTNKHEGRIVDCVYIFD